MSKILDILNEISAEPGTNKKMDILKSYKDEPLLKEVIYQAMSPRVNFYIKKIPTYVPLTSPVLYTLEEVLSALDDLSTRRFTGNTAVQILATLLGGLQADDAVIIEKIIAKDLRIGMGSTNVNKIFPKLIEDTPYMGAISFSEKAAKKLFETEGEVISQVKMDGRYANAIIQDGEIKLESRQGEDNTLPEATFVQQLKELPNCVLNGELTIPGISRYESNGIIASLVSIQGKINEGEDVTKEIAKFEKKHMSYDRALDRVTYTVWDCITLEEYADAKSDRPYLDRLEELDQYIMTSSHIKIVEGMIVTSYAQAMEHFQEILNRGEEGTIIKSLAGAWKDGKPNWQVKMKLEMDIDLRIKGFQKGTGKNSEVYSALLVESDDSLIVTKVPGMTEEMMQYVTDNHEKLLDTIVEVKCCGLSKSRNGETYALLHPVFKKLRDDKNAADTLRSAMAIENMAKSLS